MQLCAGENCQRCDECERYTREPDTLAEFTGMIIPREASSFDGCELFIHTAVNAVTQSC